MARTKSGELGEAILLAAKGLLLERGYDGVSLEDIAEAAGTTKVTVYRHWEGKERLARAVLEAVTGWAVAAVGAPDPGAPPRRALEGYLARFLAVVTSGHGVRLQRYALGEARRDPEGCRDLYARVVDHAAAELARWMRARGVGRGAEAVARVLLAEATAGAHLAALFGAAPPGAETVEAALAAPPLPSVAKAAVERFLAAHPIPARRTAGRRPVPA